MDCGLGLPLTAVLRVRGNCLTFCADVFTLRHAEPGSVVSSPPQRGPVCRVPCRNCLAGRR